MTCGLSPNKLGLETFDRVHSWYESGLTDREIVARLDELNKHRSEGSVGRHRRKHLQKVVPTGADAEINALGMAHAKRERAKPRDNISILEELIVRGSSTIPTARISPDLLVKVIDMHDRMTRGKTMDATMQAISDAMKGAHDIADDEEETLESPMSRAARLSEDPGA